MKMRRFESVLVSELAARGLVADTTPPRPVVLVVDDEPLIADTIVAILNRQGFAASAAYSGETALCMALQVPPALLLTDVSMPPGMNGIELAIAVNEAIPDCKPLLFSGQASTTDLLRESRALGHDFALLPKPVHPEDLLAKMLSLLGGLQCPNEAWDASANAAPQSGGETPTWKPRASWRNCANGSGKTNGRDRLCIQPADAANRWS